ncbi:MAG: hypothetical protein ACFBSC_06410 [Microcoleaceae cyanobacterium]
MNHQWTSRFLAVGTAFLGGLVLTAQTVQAIPTKSVISGEAQAIQFQGSISEPSQIGAEYILYQTDKSGQTRGLVYIQNSDIGACFQGEHDIASNRIENLTYAYPLLGEETLATGKGGWEMNVSSEALDLKKFPHALNPAQVNQSTQDWFDQCTQLFD